LIWEFGSDEEPDWIHLSYNGKDNRKQILKAYKDKNGKSAYITFI
jgi:zinc D-Ala-D-Ala carboxypeptidase